LLSVLEINTIAEKKH